MFSSFLGFVVVISIIVFVHEFGHYLAARICKVRVLEFSIGFGKSIFEFYDKNKTKWKVGYIPLGGYVRMLGDSNAASSRDDNYIKKLSVEEKSETFHLQSPMRRMFIALAGPFANYLLSFCIFFGILFVNGKYKIDNIVSEVIINSPAEISGIKSGDKIASINNSKTPTFDKIYTYVALRPNQLLNFEIERNGVSRFIDIKTTQREIKDSNGKVLGIVGVLGIKPNMPKFYELNIIESAISAFDEIISISLATFTSLSQMITGTRSLDELRGVVTIAEQSGDNISQGFYSFILFVAMISINIGFVNLLPVPFLDGGHVVFCLYEIVTGKAPSERASKILNSLGMIFIIFMFVISTSNDIKALILR